MNKNHLRQQFFKTRAALDKPSQHKKSQKIMRRLEAMPEFISNQRILIYLSIKNEVNTREIIEEYSASKTFFLPKINDQTNLLDIHPFLGWEKLKQGAYQLWEPTGSRAVQPNIIDLVLVPGIVFDKRGHRVGYGQGYYDKLLKHLLALKIGLAFDFQIVAKIPATEYDVAVDKIITEKRVIVCH